MSQDAITHLVDLEWDFFQATRNEGGRADCQDDRETFYVMRTGQAMGWSEEMVAASEAMDFETAARIRDQIVAIRTRVEGGSAEDVIARLKAGARKGSAHATRRRYRPHKK